MCGRPSHIHGTLIHWALIFKGQQEISPLDLTNINYDCMSVSFVCVCAYVHIHLPRFQGKSVAAADCQSLAHY